MQNFIADSSQFTETAVTLTSEEHHHASRSCRVRIGELIGVADGFGKRVVARIKAIDSRMLTAVIERDVSGDGEPSLEITVALALISPARYETAVEKCTELGARRFVPVIAQRCTVKPVRLKLDRLERIAVEAAKQSGRSYIPEIGKPVPVKALKTGEWGQVLAALKDTDTSLESALQGCTTGKIAFVIGPEGGFTDEERAMLLENGGRFFSLGGLTLRSETAVIAATALAVRYEWNLRDKVND